MPRTRIPGYRKQNRPGRAPIAFVQVEKRRIYLGEYDSPGSREAYARVIAQMAATGKPLPEPAEDTTVAELAAQFMLHAEKHYRRPDGTQTKEPGNFKSAIKPLVELYGTTEVARFGPRALKTVRARMVDMDWCRTNVNRAVSRLRHLFKWGVENELVPPTVLQGLQAVAPLSRGRTDARETEPVRPVPKDHIDAVCRLVSRQVAALIELQMYTGARAGELVGLRALDIDTADAVWLYRPTWHKTAMHGADRVIFFGPRSQAVLARFIADRPIDAFLLNPKEAERERYDGCEMHRRPDQAPSPTQTDRTVGDCYTVDSYRRAIHRACDRAEIPRWSPHRLRHNAATMLRAEAGIDVAQTVLGHRIGSRITELYSEASRSVAADVIARVG